MHIIKLKECVMRINKRAQIFFYFLSHFLLTISHDYRKEFLTGNTFHIVVL